jgi:murein L,D-transpeptidase YafK
MRLTSPLLLLATAMLAGLLAGCSALGIAKDQQPLSARTTSVLAAMDTSPAAPMLVRVFKESSELEVWKPDTGGRYRLFKTYAICKWSGELGPKVKEGDYQSPEGFYRVTPGMMNPKSSYYLSFNTGFPNKLDRAYGRTGTNLMVHGDCKSVGCYAMTDEQMKEIYALARESFNGGNPSFKLELYPFRMTDENLARHASNPNIDFWRNLKQGYDALGANGRPAEVDVCEGKYVFNAKAAMPADPMGQCPVGSMA